MIPFGLKFGIKSSKFSKAKPLLNNNKLLSRNKKELF